MGNGQWVLKYELIGKKYLYNGTMIAKHRRKMEYLV